MQKLPRGKKFCCGAGCKEVLAARTIICPKCGEENKKARPRPDQWSSRDLEAILKTRKQVVLDYAARFPCADDAIAEIVNVKELLDTIGFDELIYILKPNNEEYRKESANESGHVEDPPWTIEDRNRRC